ncbi:MAG: hypothetical protein ACTHQE_00105 [Thermomicrobiales bacterium]
MKRALDAGAVVIAERPDAGLDVPEILTANIEIGERHFVVLEPGFGRATEIHHDLDQFPEPVPVLERDQPFRNVRGQNSEKILEVIRHFELES